MAQDKMQGYDYTAHDWDIGESITQDKMDNLENAVETAFARLRNKADSTTVTGLTSRVNTNENAINTLNNTTIPGLRDTINQNTSAGANAWAQIESAATVEGEVNLAQRLSDIEGAFASADTALAERITLIDDPDTGTVAVNRDNIEVIQNVIDTAKGDYASLGARVDAISSTTNQNTSAIADLSGTSKGIHASLAERLNKIDNNTSGFRVLPDVDSEVVLARGKDENNDDYSTLSARLAAMDTKISSTTGVANSAIQAAKIINDTLDSTDSTAVLGGQTGGVIKTAIANAKQEAITTAQTHANTKVAKTSIADNYEGAADTVLSGVKGKDLNDRLTVAESTLSAALVSSTVRTNDQPTTFGSVDARLENVEGIAVNARNEINDAHRTGLGTDENTGLPIQDTLRDRFEAIESAATALDNALDTRIDAIDGGATPSRTLPNLINEVEAARISSVVTDTQTTEENGETVTTQVPHTYASVDARLEAIENHAAAVRNDVNTIAGELAMMDNDALVTTNTRVDTLENDLRTMANELDMLDGTAIVDTNTRIDGITTEIGNAHRTGLVNDTLVNRFEDIEESIDTVNDTLGNGFDTTNTVAAAITSAISTAASDATTKADAAKTYLDNKIYNALDKTEEGYLLDARQGKALNDTITGINSRVSTLEGKDTIIVSYDGQNSNYTDDEPNLSDPSLNADYLIADDNGKYFYWRYFGSGEDQGWQMVGGAGGSGSGNTSGINLTRSAYNALALGAGYAENTDYYVTEENGLIRHYRYENINNVLTEIEIGPLASNIKRYNISSGVETVKVDNVDTDVTYLYLHEFDYGEENDEPSSDTIITRIPLPAGGGAVVTTQKMVRITERNIVQPLGVNTPVELKFFYTSGIAKESGIGQLYIDDVPTGNEFSVTSGDPADASSTWPSTSPLPDGFYSIDVSQYCTELGTQQFRIKISDPDDETGTLWKDLKWSVNVMNLTISSTFTEHSVNALNTRVKFIYTANGDIDKVVHFKLGETTLSTVNLSRDTSGVPQEYNITMPQAGAGAYKLEVWLTATANGHDLPPSQSLYRDIIWYDTTSSDMIMSSPYRGRVNESVTQYDTLEIPYTITGGTTPYIVYYYVDDMANPVNQVTLTGNAGVWEYRALQESTHNLKIECGTAAITFSINVTKLPVDIAPETLNLIIDFNPQGITNTSSKRLWTNGTYNMTVSNNFDWYNGGYGSDDSGDYFLVKAGTRAVFDYKMFVSQDNNGSLSNEVFENGKELKIIFKTSAVRNADAVWFTNMGPSSSNENAKQVGIELSAHDGFLKTDAASKTAVGGVAATNTYLYFPYSEEDKIELDININKTAENNNFIMSYEDGCPSKAYPYKTSEILYHIEGQEQDITIGSDDCDVYIYRMRVYDSELTTEQVLRNFIADGKDSSESIDRYNRNCIYYDTNKKVFTPYTNNNTILDPERLATKIPDVKVLMLETPRFTTNKKDFVPYSSLRCIHAPGGKRFKSRGKEDNWLFLNGYHAGQGTTSDKYGNAGRNLDFLFMCDGIHNPSDKVKPGKGFIPGYQSSLILGYGTEDQQEPTYCLDWKDEDTWTTNKEYELGDLVRYGGQVYKCIAGHTSTSTFDSSSWAVQTGYTSKVTLTSTSIPNNFFNLKVNIASSENANNALLQKRYNDFLPYLSPAYDRDNRIKNDMEFVPAVIFVKETGIMDPDGAATEAERTEFGDSEWHFYALGNIGDSKKTDYTRAYDPQDMNEFTLEISDNNTNNSQFQSGVYMANYYRVVENPIVDDIGEYYVSSGITDTVTYNNETQYYGNFIKTLDTEIDNEHTYYTFIEQRRAIEPYTLEQDLDDGKPVKDRFGNLSYTARSAAGQSIQTTEYLFPLLPGEWNSSNMRYWSLFNEGFDGDHSFEMRYACKGDYRDGKVVNDTTGHADDQLTLNEGVWRAFYTWLVTADDTTFVNELDQWVVRSSVEYYYAFTHYYTMMDNRAKNTFWHFAKTGKHRRVTHPVAALLHIYEEGDGNETPSVGDAKVYEGNFTPTSDTVIDDQKQYYTQYAFDMWVYDTDTALGIDNNGELIFPYGKEDTDYRIEGDASSSMVFNGAGSIFWCRLRDNCIEDIRGVFTSIKGVDCFSSTTLINEFDRWQECYPEAIWRLDVERKYIRSFTGDTGPNGVYLTRQETRFLRDMMQGRKKYQRRQWVKDQDIYFGSKYMLPSVRDDFFEFSCYQPAGQAVTPNWDLTITPYQDMYINISYAETFASPFRAKAGVTYEFKSIFDQMNDSRIRVFGANHIQGLAGKAKREDPNDPEKITGADGLASFYIKANNFEHGKKLRKLILGTDNTSYQNGNFTTLNIANDYPILEEFNIKNCGNLGGALDLSKSTALKIVEAQGTQITQVLLPSSTGIETLHLPETITKIELKSAKQLTDISMKTRAGVTNYDSLTQLDINDSDYSANINWMTVAKAALSHLDLLSLLSLKTSSINDISELEPFRLRKSAISRVYLGGILKVLGTYSTVEKNNYETLWRANNLTLDVSNGTFSEKYLVTFRTPDYDDGEGNVIYGTEIKSMYIRRGDPLPDIYEDGTLGYMPTRESTVKTIYTFGLRDSGDYISYSGWSLAPDEDPISVSGTIPTITGNMTVYVYFHQEEKEYQVRWYMKRNNDGTPDESTFVKSSSGTVKYGKGETLEAPTIAEIHTAHQKTYDVTFDGGSVTYSIFAGWEKLPTNINPSASDTTYNIFASWEGETNKPLVDLFANVDNLSPEQLVVLSAMSSSLRTQYVGNRIGVGSRFTYEMGQDSIKVGTPMISSTLRLRQTAQTYNGAVDTGIIPFNSTNDAFTIMIDYCFDPNSTYNNVSAAVLGGCYYRDTTTNTMNSIALYYNLNTFSGEVEVGPRVGFGDWLNNKNYSVPVGNSTTMGLRNVIVLRHMKDDNNLYIYSGYGNNGNSMNSNISTISIPWSSQANDATFWFGRLSDITTSAYTDMQNATTKAIGTVYVAKYWNEDLGVGECKRLASWPHEPMTYAITTISNSATNGSPADDNTPVPAIGIVALTASNHSRVVQTPNTNVAAGTAVGWGTSTARTICNNRIMAGLPTKLQAVLSKPMVKFYNAIYGDSNGIPTYTKAPNTSNSNDYIYLSSIANLDTSGGTEYTNEVSGLNYETAPFSYLDESNVTYYTYTSEGWVESEAYGLASYLNLRFPVKPLNGSIRVFKESTTVPSNTTIISTIRSVTTPDTGDIFVTTSGQAYMYVKSTDLPSFVYGEPNTGRFADNNGTWIASKEYWLRSMTFNSMRAGFAYVKEEGSLVTSNTQTNTLGLSLNYQYTI